ncbi:MAG: hypothetical protein P4L33_17630 [Capsulimonadaceae bacterium]|nr:hypothetical protein [Capsulimonadaceae bacterium]
MKNNRPYANEISNDQSEAWVREALDPDQLSKAKQHLGPLALTGVTVALLWGLRVYVVLMTLMIGLQVCNAFHGV